MQAIFAFKMRCKWNRAATVAFALGTVLSNGVGAVTDDAHLLPRTAPTPHAGSIIEQERQRGDADPATDQVLVAALNGIILFDATDELKDRSEQTGVDVSLLDFAQKELLASELQVFVGQPLTLGLLDKLNRAIVDFGRQHDRPVIDAFAPEGQDVTDGVVQIIVVVGRRGDVQVEGIDGRSAQRLIAHPGIAAGERITGNALRAELEWLNRNPFRSVNIVLERGQRFGETDLIYAVQKRRPYRIYGAVEDTGTRLSGKQRWLTGFNWGDVFNLGHQLNYQFTSSFDTRAVKAHSVGYSLPLSWRHTLDLYGVTVDSKPDVTAGGFELKGRNWQAGFRYRIPFGAMPKFRQHLEIGYDHKRANNDLAFGRIRVSDTQTTISQFSATYGFAGHDPYGHTSASVRLAVSPGGMGGGNEDRAFVRSRAGASADYMYIRASLYRTTLLPRGFIWSSQLTLQGSNENLLGSEQLEVGGHRSVRGYDEYEIPADIGVILRNEIRTPRLSLLDALTNIQRDRFVGLVFSDYGMGRSKDRLFGEPISHLWSAGVGLRYSINTYVDIRFDYGWQLKDIPTSDVGAGRAHFAIVVGY